MKEVKSIFVNGIWLSVGGDKPLEPFLPQGFIENIVVYEDDPRNMAGADSAFVKVTFDDGFILEIKTNEYMAVRKQ